MRGRKKTPAKVLQFKGNPGGRRINVDEPEFAPAIPDPTMFFLSEKAREYWNYYAPILHEQGILTVVDGGVLAAYCCALASLYAAEADIETNGRYQYSREAGEKKRPALMEAREAREQVRSLGSELGMTASGRARMKVKKPDNPKGARRFLA